MTGVIKKSLSVTEDNISTRLPHSLSHGILCRTRCSLYSTVSRFRSCSLLFRSPQLFTFTNLSAMDALTLQKLEGNAKYCYGQWF